MVLEAILNALSLSPFEHFVWSPFAAIVAIATYIVNHSGDDSHNHNATTTVTEPSILQQDKLETDYLAV